MAVALAGTGGDVVEINDSDTTATGYSYTIPSDAEAVIVLFDGYDGSTSDPSSLLSDCNWDNGGTQDFTSILVADFAASDTGQLMALVMTDQDANWPGTGAKTLYVAATASCSDGGIYAVISIKGLDTSDPVGNTDKRLNDGGSGNLTLSDNASPALGFMFQNVSFGSSPTGNLDGTEIATWGQFNSDYMVGSYKADDTSLTATQDSNCVTGAFTINGAATGNTITSSVSDVADTAAAGLEILEQISAAVSDVADTAAASLQILEQISANISDDADTAAAALTGTTQRNITASVSDVADSAVATLKAIIQIQASIADDQDGASAAFQQPGLETPGSAGSVSSQRRRRKENRDEIRRASEAALRARRERERLQALRQQALDAATPQTLNKTAKRVHQIDERIQKLEQTLLELEYHETQVKHRKARDKTAVLLLLN